MAQGTLHQRSPQGCARWLARAPIWLYRAHLGWLLGSRFLMIEHTGRTSGKRRYAVVEVVRHDREAGAYVVASGWGNRADWYRNIRITPEVQITVGARRFTARAMPLPVPEATRELCRYAQSHPAAFAALSRVMLGGGSSSCESVGRFVPVVVFKQQAADG